MTQPQNDINRLIDYILDWMQTPAEERAARREHLLSLDKEAFEAVLAMAQRRAAQETVRAKLAELGYPDII